MSCYGGKINPMDARYEAQKYEQEIYLKWEKSGAFAPSAKGKPYTILMPPPNANASLHAGHAMYTVDDILIRFRRMQGFSALWLPGMDHAGFETQYVYEKHLAKQGKSRMDFDRKTLYGNVSQFVQQNSGLIYEQFKRLGFSADWSRSVFTLDDHVVRHVIETFARMEKEGLVYRDLYIVNFCTHCGTSLAELEVKYEERPDPLIYMKYGPFIIATARPETKFRDTALAVNPKDKRYKKYIGQILNIMGLLGPITMTVIPDPEVDPEFGTGIMKVTPAHDPHDFELGKKFNLPVTPIIDTDGRMDFSWFLDQHDVDPKYRIRAKRYHRQKVAAVRALMLEDLKKDGLLVKVDEHYVHRVGTCYRCKHVLEPLVVPNWFINVVGLKKPVIEAAQKGRVKFFPARFKTHMLQWLNSMHDWPISRQIAWGIRIPVWYHVDKNPDMTVGFLDARHQFVQGKISELLKTHPFTDIESGLQYLRSGKHAAYEINKEKPGDRYLQETDTFDTWFSSGQWPLVTLREEEFKTRFPTDVMGTLSDILKFWVSRMILFSLYEKQEVPFKDVYLWSMVADAKGQKMSKSKGNVINPIELVEKYGADALRMSLIYGTAPGSKVILAEDKVRAMRNFTNKLWNIARYVSEFTSARSSVPPKANPSVRTKEDDWIMKELHSLITSVTKHLERYRFDKAAEELYDFTWHKFADIYLEKTKHRNIEAAPTLRHVLETLLKLLHPFVPFVTEAAWQILQDHDSRITNNESRLLITAPWPIESPPQS